jgi:hypothetical protein
MNLLVCTSPDELRRTMQALIEYYKHRRYHEAMGNPTPADVYYADDEKSCAGEQNRNNARSSGGCAIIWAVNAKP